MNGEPPEFRYPPHDRPENSRLTVHYDVPGGYRVFGEPFHELKRARVIIEGESDLVDRLYAAMGDELETIRDEIGPSASSLTRVYRPHVP